MRLTASNAVAETGRAPAFRRIPRVAVDEYWQDVVAGLPRLMFAW